MSENTSVVHDLIERLGNLVRADVRAVCLASDVRLVQLEALHYLTQCNRYSDTLQAVAEYLGLTKGTVSQTLKVLGEKGLLRKQGDTYDRRLVHLKPTAKGRRLVQQVVPSEVLSMGIDNLSETEQQVTLEALRLLLRSVQKANNLKTFAHCHTCRFNKKIDGSYFCELTQEPLAENDIVLICREHQYAERAAAT